MNLRPVGREEFEAIRTKRTPLEAIIVEFINMNIDCAEVTQHNHKTAESAVASLNAACRRMNVGVACKMMKGKPYLLKEKPEVK